VLGRTFRGVTMAVRPEGPGQGSTNRLDISVSYVICKTIRGIPPQ
jgi:hypothetical protein